MSCVQNHYRDCDAWKLRNRAGGRLASWYLKAQLPDCFLRDELSELSERQKITYSWKGHSVLQRSRMALGGEKGQVGNTGRDVGEKVGVARAASSMVEVSSLGIAGLRQCTAVGAIFSAPLRCARAFGREEFVLLFIFPHGCAVG